MSDSLMFDAIEAQADANRGKLRFLMLPEAGPLDSYVGVPVERIDAEGGHYQRTYEGRHFSGYEWVPE